MNTETIQILTLNKALRLKNRVTEKMAKLKQLIATHNSYREDLGYKQDTVVLFAEYWKLMEFLVELKSSLASANGPLYTTLNAMAEYKGVCAMLESLNTTAGLVETHVYSRRDGDPATANWIASITEQAAASKLAECREKLDELQDTIEEFNATHTIEIRECPVSLV